MSYAIVELDHSLTPFGYSLECVIEITRNDLAHVPLIWLEKFLDSIDDFLFLVFFGVAL